MSPQSGILSLSWQYGHFKLHKDLGFCKLQEWTEHTEPYQSF